MALHYEIAHSASLITVRTSGVFDFLKAYGMWKKIVATCEHNNCFKVLGISMLSEPISVDDAFELLNLLESAGISPKYRVAWVAAKPELLENLRLAETVLKHRSSLNVQLFETVKQGRNWLEQDDDP